MLEKHCFDYERYVNPPIKLFHDTGESMDDMKKKKVLLKTITVENVCSVGAQLTHYPSLESVKKCKRFIFLRIFTTHYYSCAQHFPRLIFASAFCEYE